MSKQASSTRIGAFVVGAIALITVVIAVFGTGQFFADMERYVIYFHGSASGLDVGSPVRLKGVDIGEVKDVTAVFTESWEFYVEVIVEVDTDAVVNLSGMEETSPVATVTALIARGLRAQLETQSMVLGQKYIRMDLFPDSELRYQFLNNEYPEIPSISTFEEQIGQTFERLVRQIEDVPIADISRVLLTALQGIDSLVNSPKVYGMIAELQVTLGETTSLLKEINGEIRPLTANANELMDAMTVAISDADTLIGSLQTVAAENQVELYMTLKELKEAARAMRNLLDYLERNPDAAIWGKD
jgi:paraquat-inducible protein B